MSVVVLFEAEFVPGGRERYLALAQKLAERARAADGFISAERFSSLTEFPAGSPGLEPREECGLSKFFDSSGICVGSSSPDFGQREPVNKYGESPR